MKINQQNVPEIDVFCFVFLLSHTVHHFIYYKMILDWNKKNKTNQKQKKNNWHNSGAYAGGVVAPPPKTTNYLKKETLEKRKKTKIKKSNNLTIIQFTNGSKLFLFSKSPRTILGTSLDPIFSHFESRLKGQVNLLFLALWV